MAYCSECGAQLPDGSAFCNSCGAAQGTGAPQMPPQHGSQLQPYGQQPQPYGQQPQPYGQQPQYGQAPPAGGNGGGNRGLVIGLVVGVVALVAVIAVLGVRLLVRDNSGGGSTSAETADMADSEKTDTPTKAITDQPDPGITEDGSSDDGDGSSGDTGVPQRADVDYETGPGGFALADPDSFAARAEGVYRLVTDKAEAGPEEYLELYSVGNNLYGCQSGYGFRAIELFSVYSDGFSATDTDETEIRALGFSVQSNLGNYYSPTPAGYTMRITDNGLSFTGYDGLGDDIFGDAAEYERMDGLPGETSDGGFNYRSGPGTDFVDPGMRIIETPGELYGLWVTLGDRSDAVYMELTPEGLAQVYQKIANTEVTLLRGTYAVAEGDDKEDFHLILALRALGIGSASEDIYDIHASLQPDGSVWILEQEAMLGSGLFANYNTLIKTTPEEIPMPAPFEDSCGRITPAQLTGKESTEELQSYLNGSWELYGRGNPTRLTPLLVMNFTPMYESVTIRRPDDGAVCYGKYAIEKLEFEESEGAWIGLLNLSFTELPADFSGSLYGRQTQADATYGFYLGQSDANDHLYLFEAGNGGTTGVTDAVFQLENGMEQQGRFVFGRERGDWRTDFAEQGEEEKRHLQKNAVFYGFVWEDMGNAVEVQYMDMKRFSYDHYDKKITVLCPMPQEYRYDVLHRIADPEKPAFQGHFSCMMYRMETDADGVIISMEEVKQYEGDMAGLYYAE